MSEQNQNALSKQRNCQLMEHRNSIQAAQYSALVRVKFDVIIQYDPVDTPRRSGTSKNSSSRYFEHLDESTALESRLQDTEYWEECPISPRSFHVNTIDRSCTIADRCYGCLYKHEYELLNMDLFGYELDFSCCFFVHV